MNDGSDDNEGFDDEEEDLDDPFDCADRIDALLAEGKIAVAMDLAEDLVEQLASINSEDFELVDPDDEYDIGEYFSDLALEVAELLAEHRPQLELAARRAAFRFWPTVDGFERLSVLSPEADWPSLREALLEEAAGHELAEEAIAVFLVAGDIVRAIAALDSSSHAPFYRMQVVEAAVEVHPEWAISQSYAHAKWAIGRRFAAAYDFAAEWLLLAGQAHEVRGSLADFHDDLDILRRHHAKNRSLQSRLDRVAKSLPPRP